MRGVPVIGKRLFWFGLGLGVGAGAAVEVRRRVQRVVRSAGPDAMVTRLHASMRDLRSDLRAAALDGKAAMRAREAELRDVP